MSTLIMVIEIDIGFVNELVNLVVPLEDGLKWDELIGQRIERS